MPRTIIAAASLPATPDKLFDMYLDAETHAGFTGMPVTLEPHAGGIFRAFDGMLSGTILHIEPKALIVQTWRSANWPLTAMDSNAPEEDFAGVSQGWEKYYWTPWRTYLTGDTRSSSHL